VNYLQQILAFHEWKDVNQLPASAIALWYELMAVCNKTGWKQEFTVPNGLLQIRAGLSRKEFEKARQTLIVLDRITYKKSNRPNEAGKYSIINFPIVQKGQREGQQEGQQEGQREEHTRDNERGTLFKHKQKHNNDAREPLVQILDVYTEISGRQEQYMNGVEREEARKLANSEIPLDFILQAMKEAAVGKKVNSFKFFAKVIPDMWERHHPQQKTDTGKRDPFLEQYFPISGEVV
jgi:hypothetical protein